VMLFTERLKIIPLTVDQMVTWVEDASVLGHQLGCHLQPVGHLAHFVRKQAHKALMAGDDWRLCAIWLIIRADDRLCVGSCSFKNLPDLGRTVEIGYALNDGFEGHGYMTEAIKAVCEWGLAHPNVYMIKAETETFNKKSENVLKKVGFALFRQGETNLWGLSSAGSSNNRKGSRATAR